MIARGNKLVAVTATAALLARQAWHVSSLMASPLACIRTMDTSNGITSSSQSGNHVKRTHRITNIFMTSSQPAAERDVREEATIRPPSARSQRKAAERAKKQRGPKSRNANEAVSNHPEAVWKRQQQEQQRQGQGRTSRRKHDFAARQEFLTSSEIENDEFEKRLDELRDHRLTNINFHPVADPHRHTDTKGIHPLHSKRVSKLDAATTTAEDVVKAIKRAQNLHDLHDIREIAHFLLEEVGEFR